MEIAAAQFAQNQVCIRRQRGIVSLSILPVLYAIVYVAEHGCTLLGLPKRFGNFRTIYMRTSRWAKADVLERAFEQLQQARVVQIKIEAVSLDSTSVNVHPDGTGATKKRSAGYRQVPWRLEHEDPPRRGGREHSRNLLVVNRPSARRP